VRNIKEASMRRIEETTPRSDMVNNGYTREMAKRGLSRDDEDYGREFAHAMAWLSDNRPFYAHVLVDVVRKETFDVKTLAIGVTNGHIVLKYNPDFLHLHTLRNNVCFLQHEIGHLLHSHLSLRKTEDPEVYSHPYFNQALDLAVDTLIQGRGEQPEWVLLPRDLNWAKERQGWKYYFDLLVEKGGAPQKGSSMPQPDGGEGNKTFDDHSLWEEVDADMCQEVIRIAVSKAWEKYGDKGWGYIDHNTIQLIEGIIKRRTVPFSRLFRGIVGSKLKVGRRHTFFRPSRRRRVPPGSTFERHLNVLFCCDDSGSMEDTEVAQCRGEMLGLMSLSGGVSIKFQRFCADLIGPLVDFDHSSFDAVKTRGYGGTNFEPVMQLAVREKPDVLVVATDGYAPMPETRPSCPVVWVLTHHGRAPKWGRVARLPLD